MMFLQILNAQNPCIKYTVQNEKENKEINFLDIKIINNLEGKYDFKIHRKDAITNIQIKPTSYINPKILIGIFKGFLHRASKICSAKYFEEEVSFLKNMFI